MLEPQTIRVKDLKQSRLWVFAGIIGGQSMGSKRKNGIQACEDLVQGKTECVDKGVSTPEEWFPGGLRIPHPHPTSRRFPEGQIRESYHPRIRRTETGCGAVCTCRREQGRTERKHCLESWCHRGSPGLFHSPCLNT